MKVTSDDLLRGMWFAVESCGEKLQAAGVLFDRGDYSLSSAIAMAARDEFGKAQLLRDLWNRAVGGSAVTMNEVRAICGKRAKGIPAVSRHEKQRAAMATVTLRNVPGLDAGLERMQRATKRVSTLRDQGATIDAPDFLAATDELDAAETALQRILAAKRCRVPDERVRLRERGLYVDLAVESGVARWSRPNEVTYAEARDALKDMILDYLTVRANLQPPFNALSESGGSPAFTAALDAWTDKPALPGPPYVRYIAVPPATAKA